MRENRTQPILLKCIFAVEALIVVTQVLGQSDLTSFLFLLTFPLTVFLWGLSIQKTLQPGDLLIIAISILAFVNVLINILVTDTSFGMSYFNKLIMFVMSLLFLQTASRMQIGRDTVRFILRTVDVLTVFLIIMFVLYGSQMFMLNGILTRYLTFRFSNPNMTALLLTCLFIVELSEAFGKQRIWSRIFHIVLSVALTVLILLTESRNALIVLLIFVLISFWLLWKKPKRLTISKSVAAGASIFPLVFAGMYMFLIYNETLQKMLSFLVDIGKSLDSRVLVWRKAWEWIVKSPLIGAYSQSTGGTGSAQFHNTHIDILVSYGVVILFLVCVFLYRIIHVKGKLYRDKESYVYMLGFICAIVLGIGEAALFSGGLGIYIFMGVLLLLSNQKREIEQGTPA